jgi:hypothetical protein
MNRISAFVRRFFIPLIIIAAVLVLAGTYELGRASVYRAHPELSGQEQASAILMKVGALIQLPSGEAPTIATINDAASAKKSQPFLANAQNSDVLIVYPNVAEAILYRPSTNKVIVEGPVDTGQSNSVMPVSTSTPTTASTTNATTTKSKK